MVHTDNDLLKTLLELIVHPLPQIKWKVAPEFLSKEKEMASCIDDVEFLSSKKLTGPVRQHKDDAGADLICAAFEHKDGEPYVWQSSARVMPGKAITCLTGLCFEIPPGFEMQVRPRSGLGFKYGVTLANSIGTIDAGFTGQVKVRLVNLGTEPYDIKVGDRIAQVVVNRVLTPDFQKVTEISSSDRGDGGFGSTGS